MECLLAPLSLLRFCVCCVCVCVYVCVVLCVAGPTAPLDVAHVYGLRETKGLATPVGIPVRFTPKQNVRYSSRFRVGVKNGDGFDIVLSGRGTYDEREDKLRPTL